MIICIDFDGTLVRHEFPEIGEEVEGAFKYLRLFQKAGAQLILWTIRANERGAKSIERFPEDRNFLDEAVEYCRERGVEFWGVNRNPTQGDWSASPKAYAHLYIDDAAFGCPLIFTPLLEAQGRPYVDWGVVGPNVLGKLIIHP